MIDFSNKRIVVTGAYSGVGAALVELLAGLGAPEVIALDITEPAGPTSRFIETDMADPNSVEAAVAQIDGPIDVLFNNAGIAATQPPEKVMAVNYLGLRQLSEGLLGQINRGGAIVNTASLAGGQWADHLGQVMECLACDRDAAMSWIAEHPDRVGDGYAFSKECVQVYTMMSSKRTLESGVRTNSVCPAPIDTPLIPAFKETMSASIIEWTIEQCGGEIATPDDIARSLIFLGSDLASYVNGVNLAVDNGFTAGLTTGQLDFSGLG